MKDFSTIVRFPSIQIKHFDSHTPLILNKLSLLICQRTIKALKFFKILTFLYFNKNSKRKCLAILEKFCANPEENSSKNLGEYNLHTAS